MRLSGGPGDKEPQKKRRRRCRSEATSKAAQDASREEKRLRDELRVDVGYFRPLLVFSCHLKSLKALERE